MDACNLYILILGKEKEKRKVSGKENQKKGKKRGSIIDVTSQPCVPNTTSTNDSPSEAVDPDLSPTKNQPADIASQSPLLPPHPSDETEHSNTDASTSAEKEAADAPKPTTTAFSVQIGKF